MCIYVYICIHTCVIIMVTLQSNKLFRNQYAEDDHQVSQNINVPFSRSFVFSQKIPVVNYVTQQGRYVCSSIYIFVLYAASVLYFDTSEKSLLLPKSTIERFPVQSVQVIDILLHLTSPKITYMYINIYINIICSLIVYTSISKAQHFLHCPFTLFPLHSCIADS